MKVLIVKLNKEPEAHEADERLRRFQVAQYEPNQMHGQPVTMEWYDVVMTYECLEAMTAMQFVQQLAEHDYTIRKGPVMATMPGDHDNNC